MVFSLDAVLKRPQTDVSDSTTMMTEANWQGRVKMMKATSVACLVGGRAGHRSAGPVIFAWSPL